MEIFFFVITVAYQTKGSVAVDNMWVFKLEYKVIKFLLLQQEKKEQPFFCSGTLNIFYLPLPLRLIQIVCTSCCTKTI